MCSILLGEIKFFSANVAYFSPGGNYPPVAICKNHFTIGIMRIIAN